MNGDAVFFTLFTVSACLGALAVVVSQNVVRMAFWLIICLGSTAGLFFLADADFVGAVQLLIYVGGTLVLLVFAVMLTSSGPYLKIETSPGEVILAGMIGLLFLFMVIAAQTGIDWEGTGSRIAEASEIDPPDGTFDTGAEGHTLRPIGMSLLGLRPDLGAAESGTLFTGYLLPFEIVSVHLLVVLVGAAYLARAKRRREA